VHGRRAGGNEFLRGGSAGHSVLDTGFRRPIFTEGGEIHAVSEIVLPMSQRRISEGAGADRVELGVEQEPPGRPSPLM